MKHTKAKIVAPKWIPLIGSIKSTANKITYKPTVINDGPNKGERSICFIKSNITFENGSISMRVKMKDPMGQVQFGLNNGEPHEFFAGLNCGGAAYGMATHSNGKWENFVTAGYGQKPSVEDIIHLELKVTGSRCELFFDGVQVCQGTYFIKKSQITMLMSGNKEIEVMDFTATAQDPVAFVVMQFTDEFNSLYNDVIKPTCLKHGMKCIRGDDIYSNGLIIHDIIKSIRESTLIIADVTPDNPNVFYEVGFAHGIDKPTILLSDKKRDRLPFDVAGIRTIFYSNSIGGKKDVESSLEKHLREILS